MRGVDRYLYICIFYGCIFEFICRLVYIRIGNFLLGGFVVICGVDGRWDFGDFYCIGMYSYLIVLFLLLVLIFFVD